MDETTARSAERDVPVWCSEHMEPHCPRHTAEANSGESLREEVAAAFLRGLYSGKWPEVNDREWAYKSADDLLARIAARDAGPAEAQS